MSDTNSRITIRLEDGTPPVPGPPPVPPSVGPVTPPDTLGGTPSPGSSAPEAPVPPLPSTGSVPGPEPGSVIPNMPIEDSGDSEAADSVDPEDSESSTTSSGGVGATLAAVAPLRAAVVVAVVAIESLVEAVQALDSAFQEMAERGGEYDAGIAQANAVADLRLTLAEMRRANYLSTELAQYMDERSQLSVEIKDAITELSKGLLPLATETVQLLRPTVRVGTKVIRLFNSVDDSIKKLTALTASFASNPILAQNLAALLGLLKLVEHIDSLMPDPAKEDFSNFRKELQDFLNPVTSRAIADRELAAAMALPDRDRVFPAFRP